MRAALVAICTSAALAACSEAPPTEPSAQMHAIDRQIVASQFGESVDPTLVVAQVGETTITSGDVAAWLDLFPTLTVEQAVDDLVDAVAARAAYADHVDPILERDGEIRGRFYTWIQHEVLETIEVPAELEGSAFAAADDVAGLSEWGNPELTRASHLLLRAANAAEGDPVITDAVRQAAERAFAELSGHAEPSAALLGRYVDANASSLALSDVEARAERHLVFPRRYSGRPCWDGQAGLVEPFADAAFEAPVGSLLGPIETVFGLHIILVEAHLPANLVDAESRRAIVTNRLLSSLRIAEVQRRLESLVAQSTVVIDPDAVLLLAQDQGMRMEIEQRGMQQRFE